ncbi:MAG TPA: HAD-IA family hydrolase [Mycobacteriales bacterium]|jgi:putative hydrolase of the HAD superfamily|nr:HAD-IA family hydrolase [Mycobacteriales bacterium]
MQVCLFDMDGVVRQWEPRHAMEAEAASGLPVGALRGAAFSIPEYDASLRGEVTFADWCAATRRELAMRFPHSATALAVDRWQADKGAVDHAVVSMIRRTRRLVPVGLLSNAHDALPSDLRDLGLDDLFDEVICSAEVGLVKPDLALYRESARRFDVSPADCFFTDDTPVNVLAARRAGIDAELFTDAADLSAQLQRRLPLAVSPAQPVPRPV